MKIRRATHKAIWLVVKIAVVGVWMMGKESFLEFLVGSAVLVGAVSLAEGYSADKFAMTDLEELAATRLKTEARER